VFHQLQVYLIPCNTSAILPGEVLQNVRKKLLITMLKNEMAWFDQEINKSAMVVRNTTLMLGAYTAGFVLQRHLSLIAIFLVVIYVKDVVAHNSENKIVGCSHPTLKLHSGTFLGRDKSLKWMDSFCTLYFLGTWFMVCFINCKAWQL